MISVGSTNNMRIPLLFLVLTVAVIADEDYYKLLGIERDADDRTIRKAFKKLAIQKHPDKNKVRHGFDLRSEDIQKYRKYSVRIHLILSK
ncbi:DnaJ domain protein [Ancylostoma caninum]|uniref:DnaJ domain protein n=1 Tax=Ancylostoma caninum TaxID=29170 RepID=A0A368FFI6_ANCCA|nr:DnaJ domain protein [Ancylostoma caninum]